VSSYIDAIEKVLTGSCSTVESGEQGITWARYGQNVQGKKCYIGLTVIEGGREYSFQFDGRACKFPALEKFVEAARQQSFILRRRILLSFINCKPADRYKALEGFLNLSSYESFERGLKTAKLSEESRASVALERVRAIEPRIRTALAIPTFEAVTRDRCILSVNAVLPRASLRAVDTDSSVAARLGEIEAQLASFSNIEELTRLTALSSILQAPPSLAEVANALSALVKEKERLAGEELRLRGSFFEDVLQKGLQWITADNLRKCPLCENSISIEDVKKSVERRLSENQALTACRAEIRRIVGSLVAAVPALLAAIRSLSSAIALPLDKSAYVSIASSESALADLSGIDSRTDVEDLRKVAQVLDATAFAAEIEGLKSAATAALSARPNEKERFDLLTSASRALSCLNLDFPNLLELRGKEGRAALRATNMQKVCEYAEAARKAVVADVVSRVAGLADKYFRMIHPDENIGSPSLHIAKVGTASLNLSSEFYSKVGDPRGLYSEGHIDSLGLCLFLAIRRLHYDQFPELSILVLDDVLHSVDGEHRKRTAELIFEEFRDHQLIITTHDPIWYRHLCQKAQKSPRRFTYHRIGGWTLAEGPKWGDHLADYEWLSSKHGILASPHERAAKAGRLLEELLQNCCDRTGTAVPFRIKGDYTVDPLWVALYKKAKGNKGFMDKAAPTLAEIDQTREARNFGAHWNAWSQQLTQKEADRFVRAVLSLRELVFCADCIDFFNEIDELEELWACKKLHLRYAKKGDIPLSLTK
jgi:hypothetical protein